MARPKIVLGLGNPGPRYRGTRHNLGFRVLDRLADRCGSAFTVSGELDVETWTTHATLRGRRLVLAKPCTFMNRSGQAAASLATRYSATPEEMLVVYDDADLELGRLRLRPSGGDGGHNGLRSLIETLGTEHFPRLKLGVRGPGRESSELADYVLRPFEHDEEPVADSLADLAAEAVESVVEHGLVFAMNRYNARLVSKEDEADRSEEEK